MSKERIRISKADALEQLTRASLPFVKLWTRASLTIEYYIPKDRDLQTPHDQDEVYVVTAGSGIYQCNGERVHFEAGDVLFAAAGVDHRFERFSDDFETWVIFYGPTGGEIPR